ncbi:MAG: metal-sulfur cluster assembly factor [Candidatus Roizmanbacteria bacterium]|nr:MAG: metal-sulfur cluster assembly factor [Candidatus Roizmanbacteria bacterium]
MKISAKKVKETLLEVIDPELNVSIVDLGLIYKINVSKENKVKITMTLTSIGCPLFPQIEDDIKTKLKKLGIKEKDIAIELTFDPPWSIEKMSETAKAILGI